MTYEDDWEILESLNSSEMARAQRAVVAAKFGPLCGSTFLDIGCGLGHLCEHAATLTGPTGGVTGIDICKRSIGEARKRRLGGCRFLVAEARSLQLAGETFDAIACVQVAEHLKDVRALLKTAHSMLKPGGTLVLVSTDWETMTWPDTEPAESNKIRQAWMHHCAHPRLPLQTPKLLRSAGFTLEETCQHTIAEAAFRLPHFAYGLAHSIQQFLELHAAAPAVDAHGWFERLARLDRAGDFHFSIDRTIHVAKA